MVLPQVRLTLVEVTAAEILPFVRIAAEHRADPAECADAIAARIASRGRAFIVHDGAGAMCGYTVQVQGRELMITAAAGSAHFDLVQAVLEIVELQATGLDSVAFVTVRPGLIRKAHRYGYEKHDNNIMRKWL